MSRFSFRDAGRLWAALTAGLFSVFALPAAAWAADNDLAARRPRGFGFFGFGTICCLVVVAAIVVGVVLLARRKR